MQISEPSLAEALAADTAARPARTSYSLVRRLLYQRWFIAHAHRRRRPALPPGVGNRQVGQRQLSPNRFIDALEKT